MNLLTISNLFPTLVDFRMDDYFKCHDSNVSMHLLCLLEYVIGPLFDCNTDINAFWLKMILNCTP